MKYTRVAARYSQALFDVAISTNALDVAYTDLELIESYIANSRELLVFLRSPVINVKDKIGAFKGLFEGKVSPLMLNYLLLLAEKRRENQLPFIIPAFRELYNKHNNIAEVDITSAVELDAQQKEELEQKVAEYAGQSSVKAHYHVDAKIIGGFTVKMSDSILDNSLRRQVELLGKQLNAGAVQN